VTEEYCWAITLAEGRSCCGRTGFSVLEFGRQLESIVCTHRLDNMSTEYGLAPDFLNATTLLLKSECVCIWLLDSVVKRVFLK
jgi:hypothetical protein